MSSRGESLLFFGSASSSMSWDLRYGTPIPIQWKEGCLWGLPQVVEVVDLNTCVAKWSQNSSFYRGWRHHKLYPRGGAGAFAHHIRFSTISAFARGRSIGGRLGGRLGGWSREDIPFAPAVAPRVVAGDYGSVRRGQRCAWVRARASDNLVISRCWLRPGCFRLHSSV